MKKLSAVIILGAAIAAIAMAEGVQESDQWTRGGGFAGETESVELEGTYRTLEGHPAIQADGRTYSLSAPGHMYYPSGLAEGDALSVEGLLFDCEGECDKGADGHIRVTAAVIDGETYELADRPWGRDGAAGRRGRAADDSFGRAGRSRDSRRQPPRGRGPMSSS